MALGIPVITVGRYGQARPARTRGQRTITGDIVFSANSSFVSSGIEKRFRSRCRDIQITIASGVKVEYKRSTTHKAGIIVVLGTAPGTGTSTNSTNSMFSSIAFAAAVNSGTFVAVGT